MKSPCVAKCKNNAGICRGCLRTMQEINQWSSLIDSQQTTIMAEIKGLHSITHSCPQCQQPAVCDIQAGKSTCWCFDLEPREITANTTSTCLCRHCLSISPLRE